MQLSVIILNYNVRYFLEQCILSVQKALKDIDAEIIVVDNNSTDDSCAMVKKRFPMVKLIENKENTGFPKGNNIGVAEAEGEYICILNPDTVVAEDTFKKVLDFAIKKNDFGIGGVKLIDGTGKFLPESKRGVPTPWVAFTKILGLYKLSSKILFFNKYYAQHLEENETGKAAILVGAFMVMKRDLYLEVGGFDEDCFMYSDDIDLSYMILKTGRSNYYFPETSIIHYKGESTVKDETYMNRFREAMHFFYKKHFKVSPVFDFFMKAGTKFFTIAKKNTKVPARQVKEYVLFSSDGNLAAVLEEQFQKKVTLIDKKSDEDKGFLPDTFLKKTGVEIIFDNAFLDFKQIISIIEKYRNSTFTFKIKPQGSSFLIGSNSSNDRGEIIKINITQ